MNKGSCGAADKNLVYSYMYMLIQIALYQTCEILKHTMSILMIPKEEEGLPSQKSWVPIAKIHD